MRKAVACRDCGAEFCAPQRGRPSVRCRECRAERRKSQNKAQSLAYHRDRVRGVVQCCRDCTTEWCPLPGSGKGRKRVRCCDCNGERERTCVDCGAEFVPGYGKHAVKCCQKCARWHGALVSKKRRKYPARNGKRDKCTPLENARRRIRRMRIAATTLERFASLEIYERDRWCCGICGMAVDPKVKPPHPMSASLDHIMPLSLGGPHTRENVRLAHNRCNGRRGNKVAA